MEVLVDCFDRVVKSGTVEEGRQSLLFEARHLLFENLTQVDESPESIQLALARLFYIDKLFADARAQIEEEEEPTLPAVWAALCAHALTTRLPALLALMADCPDELVAYTAMRTIKEVVYSCGTIREWLTLGGGSVVDAVHFAQFYDTIWAYLATNRFTSKTFGANALTLFYSLVKLNRQYLASVLSPDEDPVFQRRMLECIGLLHCLGPHMVEFLTSWLPHKTPDYTSYSFLTLILQVVRLDSTPVVTSEGFVRLQQTLASALPQLLVAVHHLLTVYQSPTISVELRGVVSLVVKRSLQLSERCHTLAFRSMAICGPSIGQLRESLPCLLAPALPSNAPAFIDDAEGLRTMQRLALGLFLGMVENNILACIQGRTNASADEKRQAIQLFKLVVETLAPTGLWERTSLVNAQWIVTLCRDKDDQLITVLYRLQKIVTGVGAVANSLAANNFFAELYSLISSSLDQHVLFFAFLASVSLDHALLLDLLISGETVFLEYLNFYLKYLVSNWAELDQVLGEIPHPSPDAAMADDLANISLGDDSDEDEMRNTNILAELMTSSEPNKVETAADAVVQTLLRLKFQCQILQDKGLFPFNVTPLLKKLAQVEALYEGGGQ